MEDFKPVNNRMTFSLKNIYHSRAFGMDYVGKSFSKLL